MEFFRKIYHFNTASFSDAEHRTVRLGNLLGFLGVTVTSFYSLYYLLVLNSPAAALINQLFAAGYLLYFYYISKSRILPAILSLAFNYMGNMVIIVIFFASNRSGFHYYYLLVGPSIYFFLRNISRVSIVFVTALAFLLFFVCEGAGDRYAALVLSDSHYYFLHFSTIGIVFCLLIVIVHTFIREIDTRESRLEQSARELAAVNRELTIENEERRQAEEALTEERNRLQKAFEEIKTLSGMLPICASCKKIRDDHGYWNQLESFIMDHSDAQFSHSLCPKCAEAIYGNYIGEDDSS